MVATVSDEDNTPSPEVVDELAPRRQGRRGSKARRHRDDGFDSWSEPNAFEYMQEDCYVQPPSGEETTTLSVKIPVGWQRLISMLTADTAAFPEYQTTSDALRDMIYHSLKSLASRREDELPGEFRRVRAKVIADQAFQREKALAEMDMRIERNFTEQLNRARMEGDPEGMQRAIDGVQSALGGMPPAARGRVQAVIDEATRMWP